MKKEIGNHITVSKQEGETVIKIHSPLENWQEVSLLVWLGLWTVLGAGIFYYLVTGKLGSDQNIFFVVYLAFWLYFEFHGLRSFLYKKFGYELLKINNSKLLYKKNLWGTGKIRHYTLKNITRFKPVEHNQKSFSAAYSKSFWTVANERIMFDYLDTKGLLGMHLNDRDTNQLLRFLNSELKRKA